MTHTVSRDTGTVSHHRQGTAPARCQPPGAMADLRESTVGNATSSSAERLREVYEYDPLTGLFTYRVDVRGWGKFSPAGKVVTTRDDNGYVVLTLDGKIIRAHRAAWIYMTGRNPKSGIDHVNQDQSDNRFANLREATKSENAQNVTEARSNNRSGYLGVAFEARRGTYAAHLSVRGKRYYRGGFATPQDAHEEYLRLKREHHPFAVI